MIAAPPHPGALELRGFHRYEVSLPQHSMEGRLVLNREVTIWMRIGRARDNLEIFWRDSTGTEPIIGVMMVISLVLATVGGCMAISREGKRHGGDDGRP
jgi:hypothetical protein